MEKKPILSAKDVEITFSLRGNKLNAIRKCSLDLYDGETLAIVESPVQEKVYLQRHLSVCLMGNGSITGGSIMYDARIWQSLRRKRSG